MRPLRFEELYQDEWAELEADLDQISDPKRGSATGRTAPSGVRVAALYRRVCDQLALARARSYPAYLIDRLERMTARAHQAIYYRPEFGLRLLGQFVTNKFPV